MKNFEKWEKEILEIMLKRDNVFAVVDNKPVICDFQYCDARKPRKECMLFPSMDKPYHTCAKGRIVWLYEEYVEKPKLNKSERLFCEAIKTGWLARDKNNKLYLYTTSVPSKCGTEWRSTGESINCIMLENCNPDLTFEFIKWQDDMCWKIGDLLELDVEE